MSIAAWVNKWVIHEPTAKTQIGCDRSKWADKDYNPSTSTLFGSYSHYCRVSRLQVKGKNNFSSDLIELCQQTLGWGDVNYDRDNFRRRLICSLRQRTDGDTVLTLDDALDSDNLFDNHSDNLKLPFDNHSDNHDNLLTSRLIGIED